MARASRNDVARRAGVAPSTVSIVLNGNGSRVKIAEATQQRIRDAARDLSYVPSASARMLRMQTTHTIGLLLGRLPSNPDVPVVHWQLITAIKEAQERGYSVLPIAQPTCETGALADDPYRFVREMLSQVQLAGVVCETTSELVDLGSTMHSTGVPLVWMSIVENARRTDGVGHVRIRETPGVRDLIAGLTLEPSTPSVILWGPQEVRTRLQPVEEYFTRCDRLEVAAWDARHAHTSLSRYLERGARPQVVWCSDDLLLPGVEFALSEAGLRIPDDVQVIGYGRADTRMGVGRCATSVHWPVREATAQAVSMLIDTIEAERATGGQDASPPATPPHFLDLVTSAEWGDTTIRRG